GVSETKKNASQPLERKKSLSFEQLIDQIAQGRRDEDALSSLAGRLAALDRKLSDEDRSRIIEATGGKSPRDLANLLLDAIDVDKQIEVIEQAHGSAPTPEQEVETIERLIEDACTPFDAAPVRNLLKDIKKKNDIV
ncbi:restriction endonuclease subunit R, partial [Pseudomonas sp. BGM005]|nr:restriction endonuclease subunit R [Pseudomonas sp. BG5]